MRLHVGLALVLCSVALTMCAAQTDLHGSGTVAFKADMLQILETLMSRAKPAVYMTYRAIGTPAGLVDLAQNSGLSSGPLTTSFVVSGMPVPTDNYTQMPGKVLQMPVAMSKIAMLHSLPSGTFGSGPLNLTGCLLARIFSNVITTWDHPDIMAVNPALSVPANTPIKVIGCADVAPPAMALTNYLGQSCPSVRVWPGQAVNASSSWAVPGITLTSAPDMLNMMWPGSPRYQPFSITFADYAAVAQMNVVQGASIQEIALQSTSSGAWLTAATASSSSIATVLDPTTFTTPITADWDSADMRYRLLTTPGWPITVPFMLLVPANMTGLGASGGLLKALLTFLYAPDAQNIMAMQYHVPLSTSTCQSLQQQVSASLSIAQDAPTWQFEEGAVMPNGNADYVFSSFRSMFLTYKVMELEKRLVAMEAQVKALDLRGSSWSTLFTALSNRLVVVEGLADIAKADRGRINQTVADIAEAEATAETANQIAIAGVVLAVILAAIAMIIAAVYVVRTKKLDQKYSKYLPLGVKARYEDGGENI